MSRLRRIESCDRIFFVTTNLFKGVPPLSPEERSLLLDVLGAQRAAQRFLLLGYVVMPDHAHLLTACLSVTIQSLMHQWKFKTGYAIQQRRGVHGRFWQPRYFDFICRRGREVSDKLRYIHENPVAAGLVADAACWRWSSPRTTHGRPSRCWYRILWIRPAIPTSCSGQLLGALCNRFGSCSLTPSG